MTTPFRSPSPGSYQSPFHYRDEVKQMLEDLEWKRVIDPVTESTDWVAPLVVEKSMGYALMQRDGDHWKLVEAWCSGHGVSLCELELAAAEWAIRECRLYLLGLPFALVVDHKAHVSILDQQTLDAIENPNLQRLKEWLSSYVFTSVWRKGKTHSVPDALSRSPVSSPSIYDVAFANGDLAQARHVVVCTSGVCQERLTEGSVTVNAVVTGFPTRCRTDLAARQYWSIRESLSLDDGLGFFGSRIVMPVATRCGVEAECLAPGNRPHEATGPAGQLLVRSEQRHRPAGGKCQACQERLPSMPKEPLQSEPLPTFVFEVVSADLFQPRSLYALVYADRLSGWTVVNQWRHSSSVREVCHAVAQDIVDQGVHLCFRTDGGPQFATKEFCEI